MKKIFKYTLAIVLGLALCSCDKLFDSLEGDLTRMSEEDMITTVAGLERLLSDVYNSIPMDAFNTKDENIRFDGTGKVQILGFHDFFHELIPAEKDAVSFEIDLLDADPVQGPHLSEKVKDFAAARFVIGEDAGFLLQNSVPDFGHGKVIHDDFRTDSVFRRSDLFISSG